MLSWWTNMESVAALNGWMLMATLVFAALTGIMVFLTVGKTKKSVSGLSKDLETAQKRNKALQKTAEEIRRELLQTQQHQDINQLKLKTSKSSTKELTEALLDARKRMEIAEAAIKAHREQKEQDNGISETTEFLDLELEPEGGLSESQREQLIDLLDPGPKGNVDIFCVMENEMSEMTANQLEEVLTADGWKTNGVAQSAFANPPKGLVLAVHSKETAPSYASFLQRVFSTIGIEVSAKVDNKYREWSLTIIVGTIDG
jgi:small-conductance mechanosensitive channel